MSKNIVLIGFMGVGKSLVAKHLAVKLSRPIVSTDELIVAKEGTTITKIFQDKGEKHFRDIEAKVVEAIADQQGVIVDCGGGVALNQRNIELLKKNGIIFYLSATADEIYKNVKDQQHRPLLNTPDPKSQIEELLKKRRPFYEKADHIIDANGKTGEQLCVDILTLFKKRRPLISARVFKGVEMTEQESVVLLNAIPGLGSVRFRRLVEHFGSARGVLKAKERELADADILPPRVIQKIFEFDSDNFLQSEYNLIRQFGVKIVTIFDEGYPAQLRGIHDAPVLLYVRGNFPSDDGLAVAVVGSRNASVYGMTIAERFSGQLAELGITIVSGLARGVDTAAHYGCLKTGGKTVAVLGCGLAHIYPEENKDLFTQISEKGAVISELPMATPPVAFNFPGRNRIISGLSLAVLVVEASLKSGALITCGFALEQGRDVFAVPGKIDHPNAQGVNQLIKQGARLVTCFEDIVQEIEPQIRRTALTRRPADEQEVPDFLSEGLSEDEIAVARSISKEPLYIDDLAEQSGRPLTDVTNILLKLELKRVVKQLPGKYFVRAAGSPRGKS